MIGPTHSRPRLSRRQALLLPAPALSLATLAAADPAIRFILSESLVHGVNVNDARATMSIWLNRLSQEVHLAVDFDPRVFDTTEQLHRKVRAGQFDAAALNVLEYRPIAHFFDSSQLVFESDGSSMKYVLLVPTQGGASSARELRGKRLHILEGRTACLTSSWLRTLIGAEPLERFFSSLTTEVKPSQVILPLFFGRADACLTTFRSFQTMSELNPQVGKRLRILETSPDLVATFYIFRKGFLGPRRDRLQEALFNLRNTASGRQLMTLFQFETLISRDVSCLKDTLHMLDAVDRLSGARP